MVVGPHAFAWVPDNADVRDLAEFGIVFLMFSIGLEFSLPQLKSMRRAVFGLGLAQVAITTIGAMVVLHLIGYGWQAGFALGGALAMSSTAIVSKMLAERMELATPHGRDIMGILLFQDLAVVAFLIILPSLAKGGGDLAGRSRRGRFQGRGSPWCSSCSPDKNRCGCGSTWSPAAELRALHAEPAADHARARGAHRARGLSLALGAFLAGMLIAETEYRYQVEEDIKPFRDVLLGLFFVTVGMALDLSVVGQNILWVLVLLVVPVGAKLVLIVVLSRIFRASLVTSLRNGFYLAQAGEFAWCYWRSRRPAHRGLRRSRTCAGRDGAVDAVGATAHPLRRAPRAPRHRERLARPRGADHAHRGHTDGAPGARDHLRVRPQRPEPARLLEAEEIRSSRSTPTRSGCAEPAGDGSSVVYGDAGPQGDARRCRSREGARSGDHVREHAGRAQDPASRTRAASGNSGRRAHARRQRARPACSRRGARKSSRRYWRGSLMLATHSLLLLGLPLNRVLSRFRAIREERYSLFRGFFHGASDFADAADNLQPRLYSVHLPDRANARGKDVVHVEARRPGRGHLAYAARVPARSAPVRTGSSRPATSSCLLGRPANLTLAEKRLLKG
jgi:CPA2 family monovalent cation:H+ antiporter-2